MEPSDTFGPEKSVLIKEVIWFKCSQTLHLGREYVSCSERCSFQTRFHSTPTQRYFPSGLVQYLDCGGKGESIQRLTGFRALRENRWGHPASCVYIEAEQLDLDITQDFLDLESSHSFHTHNECFHASLPNINFHALREERKCTR